MVTPFTVGAGSPKVAGNPAALWEGTQPRTDCSASPARRLHGCPPTLNQDCIDVRGPVRAHLSWSNGAAYELHILPWKSEDCPTHRTVYEGCHLLLSHDEDRVGGGGVGCSQGGIVEDEGPKDS
jgi:hypothetical protein